MKSREDLRKFFKCLQQNGDSAEIKAQVLLSIEQILALPTEPLTPIDDRLIQSECSKLSQSLAENTWTNRLPYEVQLVEQILESLSDYALLSMLTKSKHKKCTLDLTKLKSLDIQNEYDVQHLLYILFRIIFPECRIEVVQDDGYAPVRSDLYITKDINIEVKATQRTSMTLRNLTEEINADMARFSQKIPLLFCL